jgi:glycosyltransferase involved in cell wall biosynthesis
VGTKKSGNHHAMKVLYIGHYRDVSGWARAASDYILAMDSVGIDIVCRPIKLNASVAPIHPRIEELESKSSKGCDICIQHVLPHHMDYNGSFKKNIALYATETSDMLMSGWPAKINQLDEAWVINNSMVDSSKKSNIDIPIKVIPHAADISRFEADIEPLDLGSYNSDFLFYFVGDADSRKNLPSLLKAFHLEFFPNEAASLVIKTNKYGMESQELTKQMETLCSNIKNGLKLYGNIPSYKQEIIITGYMDEEQLVSLHKRCDCYLCPSYGEAWCIPAFDAMGFGNIPICSNTGGMKDFVVDEESGFLIEGSMSPVFGMNDTFQDIFTGREDWFDIDIRSLQSSMRKVFEMWKNNDEQYQKIKTNAQQRAHKYSYESVGNLIKQELENAN